MSLRRKRTAGFALAVALTLIGGAFAYHSLQFETDSKSDLTTPKDSAAHLNPNGSELVVRAYTVDLGPVCSTQSFTGTLQPRYQALVGFRVAGKIAARRVELGERVKKGQILFQLNPDDLDLQLKVAETDNISAESLLTQTKAEEVRFTQLRASGAISVSDFDLAVSAREIAQARFNAANRRLEMARNQRSYCDLFADSDGLVTAIQAEAGQVVNIGQPVIQIMQSNELEAVINLPEGMVGDVKQLDAEAHFWAKPDVKIQARLRELSPMADAMSRTYDARFQLLQSTSDLAIGMTVSVQLLDPKSHGTSIPLTAISSLKGAPVVWRIVADGKLEPVGIEMVQYRTDTAVVHGALQSGDRIVSAGVQRVDENAIVRVWDSNR